MQEKQTWKIERFRVVGQKKNTVLNRFGWKLSSKVPHICSSNKVEMMVCAQESTQRTYSQLGTQVVQSQYVSTGRQCRQSDSNEANLLSVDIPGGVSIQMLHACD